MKRIVARRSLVVADDDVLQLGELPGGGFVMDAERLDVERGGGTGEERVDIGKDDGVFVVEVFAHLLNVGIEILQDEQGALARRGVADGTYELATDSGEAEVEEIGMGSAKVVHERRQRDALGIGDVLMVAAVADEVEHGQEGVGIDVVLAAHLVDALLPDAQGDIETAHYLKEAILLADELSHLIG